MVRGAPRGVLRLLPYSLLHAGNAAGRAERERASKIQARASDDQAGTESEQKPEGEAVQISSITQSETSMLAF